MGKPSPIVRSRDAAIEFAISEIQVEQCEITFSAITRTLLRVQMPDNSIAAPRLGLMHDAYPRLADSPWA